MIEVPGDEPSRDDAEGAMPEDAPAPAEYPPPYGSASPAASDEELAAALAAQTAMYTGPITIPVLNSDPVFRPDPGELQSDVPPPVEAAPVETEQSAAPLDHEPALPPLPVPPPPPAPEYIAPDAVASDTAEFGADASVTPEPVREAPATTSWPLTPAAGPAADDDLTRTIEQEAAAGSTLDAILLLENELRRRQGLAPVVEAEEPPAGVGAAFGAAAWTGAAPEAFASAPPDPQPAPVDVPPVSGPPGWTDAPDPSREGDRLDAPAPLVQAEEPADADAVWNLETPAPVDDLPADDQAWLTAPPPSFAPPPLVEPPLEPPAGPIDTTALTPPPVSELPAPVLPPPVTTVEGPNGPVDVAHLPPPTANAVEVTPAGFQDAPPPDVGAVPLAPPPVVEAAVLGNLPAPPMDPDVEGIDELDRADLAAPIPVDDAGIASVAPVPLSTATVVAVGEPPQPLAPSDPPAMAVEAESLEPTPVERRAGYAARLFWLWFAANSSIIMVAVGATLFTLGMSLRQVLVAVVAGVAVSALPLGLGSLAGKWSGQPTMVVSRATFGVVGNIVPALLAVVGRVLWGGVLLWLLAATAGSLLAPGDSTSVTALVALAAGAVIAGVVAVLGYGLLHRVQRVLGILSTVLVVVIIAFTASHVDVEVALQTDDGSWLLAIGGAVTVFSVVGLAWAQSSSDLARYQSPAGSGAANMLWSSFGAIVPTLAILSWGAVLAASDPSTADRLAREPLAALLDLVPGVLALPLFGASAFGLVAGTIVAMYSGGLAVAASGLRAPRAIATLVAAVLVAVVGAGFLLLGSDTRDIVRDVATTVAVPVAAWTGIFASEMMIRLRRFHTPSLLERGGVYPAVRWVNLVGLVVISVVGLGLTSAQLSGFQWQGYLFGLLGVQSGDPLATTDLGVLVALVLGLVLPLATGIPAIRRQERDRDGLEAAPTRSAAQPLLD
ncbi:MAG: cytosine permease [Micrococcales bacterium]|mgnify:CR=1 FL=1|nr:cytosine permease [Micrococcales bacterium]OJX69022.1 MAG: hypothetical protein BGO94_10610 [Micrococcales bacterium 72-143]